MDAEIVNRTKDPVEVSLTIDGVPKGWDVNFNSQYSSYPIRSVTVAGAELRPPQPNPRPSSSKLNSGATKPGTYPVKVTAKDAAGTRSTPTPSISV